MSGSRGSAVIIARLHAAGPGDEIIVREGSQPPRRYIVAAVRGVRARELDLVGVAGAKRKLIDCLDHAVLVRRLANGTSEARRVTSLEIVAGPDDVRLDAPVGDPGIVGAGTGAIRVGPMDMQIKPDAKPGKPTPADLADLIRCESGEDLARWVLARGYADTREAMSLYLASRAITG